LVGSLVCLAGIRKEEHEEPLPDALIVRRFDVGISVERPESEAAFNSGFPVDSVKRPEAIQVAALAAGPIHEHPGQAPLVPALLVVHSVVKKRPKHDGLVALR
jgi:hypothetical protein